MFEHTMQRLGLPPASESEGEGAMDDDALFKEVPRAKPKINMRTARRTPPPVKPAAGYIKQKSFR